MLTRSTPSRVADTRQAVSVCALHAPFHDADLCPSHAPGTTGLVLDSGDGVTHSVPVFEGFSMPHAIRRIDLAGRDVTEQLQLLLRGAGYDMKTSAEREVVRGLKEEACYLRAASASGAGGVGSGGSLAGASAAAAAAAAGGKGEPTRVEEFKLPDGNTIKVRVGGRRWMIWKLTCASLTARRRATSCAGDPLQSRSRRVRVYGRASTRRG